MVVLLAVELQLIDACYGGGQNWILLFADTELNLGSNLALYVTQMLIGPDFARI